MNELISKLNNKSAAIAIVGLGYVGLPLMLRYAEVGYQVIGIDNDTMKSEKLMQGQSYIKHIDSGKVQNAIEKGAVATTELKAIEQADAIILCLPTPLNKHREPDLSFVLKTMESILPFLQKDQVLSLESTTYPGTTEEELLPRIESTGLKVGKDFYLVYSPEREDPGNINYETGTIPKVCGGHSENCLKVGIALYMQVICEVIPVSSTKAAEMTKLLENIYRAVNIGLVNEMKIVADKMDIDIHEVINAAATKPFGYTAYYPGPGLGGHCIPIDPFYLTWKAREYNIHTRFIELAGEVNRSMPDYVVSKTADALNRQGKPLKGCKVLILGLAYKADVDDTRESPSFEIMELLINKGAHVSYSDPYIPQMPIKRDYKFDFVSVDLTKENIELFDCVIIVTNHKLFDYELIKLSAQLIIDSRGVYKQSNNKIIKA